MKAQTPGTLRRGASGRRNRCYRRRAADEPKDDLGAQPLGSFRITKGVTIRVRIRVASRAVTCI